jgi:hypothetical protein
VFGDDLLVQTNLSGMLWTTARNKKAEKAQDKADKKLEKAMPTQEA